jgi:DnaJ-class molecular chaperone
VGDLEGRVRCAAERRKEAGGMTCPVCMGSGYEYIYRSSPASVIRCSECDGAGTVEAKEEAA